MTVGIVHDARYLAHEAPGHCERPERLVAIRDGLVEAGLWDHLVPIAARPATDEDLRRVHAETHVARVRATAEAERLVWFDGDTFACRASAEAASLAAGGTCAAAEAVAEGIVARAFCAVRPPGHHAMRNRAMGFCLLNNVAIAARHVQAVCGVGRILILDWDVHHGNGTQATFYDDPSVLYVSIHQAPLYPGTGWEDETGEGAGEGLTRNYPLRSGSGDAEFLAAVDAGLEAAEAFRPEFVFVSAGFDAHLQDPLAGLRVTDEGFAAATRRVCRLADRTASGRLVSVLEGGYDLEMLRRTVAGHIAALVGE